MPRATRARASRHSAQHELLAAPAPGAPRLVYLFTRGTTNLYLQRLHIQFIQYLTSPPSLPTGLILF